MNYLTSKQIIFMKYTIFKYNPLRTLFLIMSLVLVVPVFAQNITFNGTVVDDFG